MSGVHKHPTISFRVSDREREMIEAKILASGMQKKDYFVQNMCCRQERGHLSTCRGIAEYADESFRTGKTTGTAGGNTYCCWIGRYAK